MRVLMRRQEESPVAKAWADVFNQLVLGHEYPPEEPCHKCVRIYGILASEISTAYNSIADHSADADYAAADALNAADTVKLLAEEGCIARGFITDTDAAITKIGEGKEFDKDDVEEATDALASLKILDDVVARCKGGVPP